MIFCPKCENVFHFNCLPEPKSELPKCTDRVPKILHLRKRIGLLNRRLNVPNVDWSCPRCRPHHKENYADFQVDFGGSQG